jgi:beta-galactosidase
MIGLTAHAAEPTREHYNINDGWRFYFANELDSDNAHYVTLPHTWNTNDTGYETEYKRTTANYLRTTWIPKEWQGKRLFLRFHGVQSVANVFVNAKHVGEHHGGYTAFTMEITDMVRYGEQN